jgi:hypothetical protein
VGGDTEEKYYKSDNRLLTLVSTKSVDLILNPIKNCEVKKVLSIWSDCTALGSLKINDSP